MFLGWRWFALFIRWNALSILFNRAFSRILIVKIEIIRIQTWPINKLLECALDIVIETVLGRIVLVLLYFYIILFKLTDDEACHWIATSTRLKHAKWSRGIDDKLSFEDLRIYNGQKRLAEIVSDILEVLYLNLLLIRYVNSSFLPGIITRIESCLNRIAI